MGSMRAAAGLAIICVLAALMPARAAPGETPLSGAEFDAASVGKTLYYNSGSVAYGAEQYLPGRRVLWAFIGDQCMEGYWYEENGYICFVYEDFPDPQCWTFLATANGLSARFRDDPADLPLIAVQESPEPLACAGPHLGV